MGKRAPKISDKCCSQTRQQKTFSVTYRKAHMDFYYVTGAQDGRRLI